jgi:hypothetical protein
VTAYLAALKAVATAATEAVHDATRRNGRSCPAYLLVLERALATLRALPESGEEALKPGEEVAFCCVSKASGYRGEMRATMSGGGNSVWLTAYETPIFDGKNDLARMVLRREPGLVVGCNEVAELRAVLARVRVP